MCLYVGLRVQWSLMSNSFIVPFCFNPFLPLKSKNSQHPEKSVSNSLRCIWSSMTFATLFSCLLWHLYCPCYLRQSHQTSNWLQKGGSREPDIVLLGLPEWFSKWFVVTWRQMFLMFASSWWFIGRLMPLFSFSLSAGGWVALRWVYQGSVLQPRKVWGEFKWCLSVSNVTLLYCFIRHLSLSWGKQVSELML